jgi:hypothetical protein
VFFSEEEVAPGVLLDAALLKALYDSKVLVVVLNQGTLEEPRWVRTEVEAFRSRYANRPIIPVIPEHAFAALKNNRDLEAKTEEWLPLYGKKIWVDESDEAIEKGEATDTAVKRLELAPAGLRSKVKWRRLVGTVFTVLIGLLGELSGLGIPNVNNAKRHRGSAELQKRMQRRR